MTENKTATTGDSDGDFVQCPECLIVCGSDKNVCPYCGAKIISSQL